MSVTDGSGETFLLSRWRHWRRPAGLLAVALLLGGLSWPLDRAASAAGGGWPLVLALLLNVALGLAELAGAISFLRAFRGYRVALHGGHPAPVLTVAPHDVLLHLAGVRLAWREIGEVRIAQRPRGGKLLPGPLARRLPPETRILFGVADPVRGFSRISGAMQPAARRALFRYRTPFTLDPARAAAPAGDIIRAIKRYAACPVRQVVLSGRAAGSGTAGRLGVVVPEVLSGQASPGQRRALEHSGLQWALLLAAFGFGGGAAIWMTAQPLHDAWLMQHGRRATAVVQAVTTPCRQKGGPAFRISFPGPGGVTEITGTSRVAGCPRPGTAVQVIYDPRHPADVGDITLLRTTPIKLLTVSVTVAFMGILANIALQFWRDPVIIQHETRVSYGLYWT